MTAILGYADGEHVWISGDSAAQNGGWSQFTIRERKVWRAGDFIIGITGRLRIGQLMQALFVPPQHPGELKPADYFVISFIPTLRELLRQHDESMTSDASGTGLIIGYRGVVYHMDSAFNVNAIEPQIVADGAGGDVALGAFCAFRESGVEVESSMRRALEIAGQHDLTVAPPFYVLTL